MHRCLACQRQRRIGNQTAGSRCDGQQPSECLRHGTVWNLLRSCRSLRRRRLERRRGELLSQHRMQLNPMQRRSLLAWMTALLGAPFIVQDATSPSGPAKTLSEGDPSLGGHIGCITKTEYFGSNAITGSVYVGPMVMLEKPLDAIPAGELVTPVAYSFVVSLDHHYASSYDGLWYRPAGSHEPLEVADTIVGDGRAAPNWTVAIQMSPRGGLAWSAIEDRKGLDISLALEAQH